MYGINAKLSKAYFQCHMCRTTKMQEQYIWGNFAILPEYPYKEQKICKKCAIREAGTKTGKKRLEVIDELYDRS